MNVFEDLIVELKQENLLERTVIDDHPYLQDDDLTHLEETVVPNAESQPFAIVPAADAEPPVTPATEVELDDYDSHLHETVVPAAPSTQPEPHKQPSKGQEFYRKRAMAEVSTLQMVEHVLTGVEREYMKIRPQAFDDFQVKKTLNMFLQVTENENSAEHQEAEFKLITETEAWCTALAERDREIPVHNLRRYCENSRPPLSSQALVALARFYRNLPCSTAVRAKFDFIITRLFSRAAEDETRTVIFTREEMLGHIRTLYREWSSIAVYGDDDENKLGVAALSFEDLAVEAESVSSFDQLIEHGFFNRLRSFKDSVGEIFYAPSVLAAAIDANVRIGNAYIRLIDRERHKMDEATLRSKYGVQHDELISVGIGRTLELVDLLRLPLKEPAEPAPEPEAVEPESAPTAKPEPAPIVPVKSVVEEKPRPAAVEWLLGQYKASNKILLIVALVLVVGSAGVYVYANYLAGGSDVLDTSVRDASISDPLYQDYVTTGRISQDTFYGMLLPTWDSLSKEKKQEILTKIYQDGTQQGYTQVNLIAPNGKPAGFASATRLEVYSQ